MKKNILDLLKKDDYMKFGEFLHAGGDRNLKIYGKTLIEHAFRHKSINSLYVLLSYGPDLTSFMAQKNWMDQVDDVDPWYFTMIDELIKPEQGSDSKRIQTLLNECCRYMVGDYPLSYRNVYTESHYNFDYQYKELLCGLHWFEYMNWDYLTVHLKRIFDCENNGRSASSSKYAMVVSARPYNKSQGVIQDLNVRMRGFLVFREVPASKWEEAVKQAREKKETIIGIRFNDEAGLRSINDESSKELDVSFHFLSTMKDVICDFLNPRTIEEEYIFTDMRNWDHQLNSWVLDFKKRNGVFPNILLASSLTYAQIDIVANTNAPGNIANNEQERPEEFASMSGFRGRDYELGFCIDEALHTRTVKLIRDTGPGEEETIENKLKAAS